MRPLVTVTALLLVGLAGCSGGDSPGEDEVFGDLNPQATSTTGLIRGIVVDEAIRPLADATVALRLPGGDRTAVTKESGAFAFDGLDPGTYFLFASRPGSLPTQTSADVVAGVAEPAIVRVVLAVDASFVAPFFEQFVFEGFIECSTGGGTPVGYAYYSACSSGNPATGEPLFPNDRFNYEYVLSRHPAWVQDEMVWQSTQSVSQWLSHSFHYSDPSHTDGQNDLSVEGPSPLLNTMDEETAKEYIEGLDYPEGSQGADLVLRGRIFTWATDDSGPALTVQQRFTVYTTVFYGYVPPADWRFTTAGEVPQPPQ